MCNLISSLLKKIINSILKCKHYLDVLKNKDNFQHKQILDIPEIWV